MYVNTYIYIYIYIYMYIYIYGEVFDIGFTSNFPACCWFPWTGFCTWCRGGESSGSDPENLYWFWRASAQQICTRAPRPWNRSVTQAAVPSPLVCFLQGLGDHNIQRRWRSKLPYRSAQHAETPVCGFTAHPLASQLDYGHGFPQTQPLGKSIQLSSCPPLQTY